MNNNGIYFPLWFVCQGFEQLSIIEGRELGELSYATSKNIPNKLEFLRDENNKIISSRMYANMDESLLKALEEKRLSYHNNEWRMDPKAYELDSGLQKYKVIALSHDRDGRPMVASIEHKYYPIYSHQWHPEKNAFVWIDTLPIPHSKLAIDLSKF